MQEDLYYYNMRGGPIV